MLSVFEMASVEPDKDRRDVQNPTEFKYIREVWPCQFGRA